MDHFNHHPQSINNRFTSDDNSFSFSKSSPCDFRCCLSRLVFPMKYSRLEQCKILHIVFSQANQNWYLLRFPSKRIQPQKHHQTQRSPDGWIILIEKIHGDYSDRKTLWKLSRATYFWEIIKSEDFSDITKIGESLGNY